MGESDRRKGVVYVSQWLDDAMRPVDWFVLHWEDPNARPPVFYEEGPGFSTADEAIAWGRERARVVLIRVGAPPVYYSAGDDSPESVEPEGVELHPPVPPWPNASTAP